MSGKTYQTAVVLIPPEECWEPIQTIRRARDRQVRRWMPHVNLLYPFRPRQEFDQAAAALQAVARGLSPFDISLNRFRHFGHGRGNYTIWLAPEPAEALAQLQAALRRAIPDCDELSRRGDGFRPHLSVGQVRGRAALERLRRRLQENWHPLRFTVRRVSLIWRGAAPNDVFRVDRQICLGGEP